MRFRAEGELSKIREKLNWQASARMDDRVAVSSVEEELHAVRVSKRKLDKRTMELEDTLQKVARQLRHKKREALDVRKRVDALMTERNFMQQQLLHNGILDASVSLARSIKDRKQDTTGRRGMRSPMPPRQAKKGNKIGGQFGHALAPAPAPAHTRATGVAMRKVGRGGSYARSPRRQRHVQAIRSKIEFLEGAN